MSTRDAVIEDHQWVNAGPLPVTIVDVHRGKPVRLQVKVLVPTNDHPNYNFVGKLLGPKGNSLKWLQEQTQTKMAILGRGSMRNKEKESELRKRGDPKHLHLNEDLHVEITAFAPAPEAYLRISKALYEIKRFLVPDYYDEIRKQQLKELGVITTEGVEPSSLQQMFSLNSQLDCQSSSVRGDSQVRIPSYGLGAECADGCAVSSSYWLPSQLSPDQPLNGCSRPSQSQHVSLKNTNKSLKSNTMHSKPYSKPMRNPS